MFTFDDSNTFNDSNPSPDLMKTLREAFAASNLSWDDFEATMCDSLDELYAEEEAKKNQPTPTCSDQLQDPATLSWEDLFDSIIRPWCVANLSNGSTINDLDAEDYAAYRNECFNYLQEAINAYLNAHKVVDKLKTAISNNKTDLSTLMNLLFGDR